VYGIIPRDRQTDVCLTTTQYYYLYYAKVDFRRNRTRAAGKAQSNYYISYCKRDSALTANKENITYIYIRFYIKACGQYNITPISYVYLYGLCTTYSYDCRIILWKYITHTHAHAHTTPLTHTANRPLIYSCGNIIIIIRVRCVCFRAIGMRAYYVYCICNGRFGKKKKK